MEKIYLHSNQFIYDSYEIFSEAKFLNSKSSVPSKFYPNTPHIEFKQSKIGVSLIDQLKDDEGNIICTFNGIYPFESFYSDLGNDKVLIGGVINADDNKYSICVGAVIHKLLHKEIDSIVIAFTPYNQKEIVNNDTFLTDLVDLRAKYANKAIDRKDEDEYRQSLIKQIRDYEKVDDRVTSYLIEHYLVTKSQFIHWRLSILVGSNPTHDYINNTLPDRDIINASEQILNAYELDFGADELLDCRIFNNLRVPSFTLLLETIETIKEKFNVNNKE